MSERMRSVWNSILASFSILAERSMTSSVSNADSFSFCTVFSVSRLKISSHARSYFVYKSRCSECRPFSFDSNWSRSCISSSWVLMFLKISSCSLTRTETSSSSCLLFSLYSFCRLSNCDLRNFSFLSYSAICRRLCSCISSISF